MTDKCKADALLAIGGSIKSSTINTKDIKKLRGEDIHMAGCLGKVKHKSASAAMVEVRASKTYLEVYHCYFCGNYHVGKNRERHKKTLKRNRKRY